MLENKIQLSLTFFVFQDQQKPVKMLQKFALLVLLVACATAEFGYNRRNEIFANERFQDTFESRRYGDFVERGEVKTCTENYECMWGLCKYGKCKYMIDSHGRH